MKSRDLKISDTLITFQIQLNYILGIPISNFVTSKNLSALFAW